MEALVGRGVHSPAGPESGSDVTIHSSAGRDGSGAQTHSPMSTSSPAYQRVRVSVAVLYFTSPVPESVSDVSASMPKWTDSKRQPENSSVRESVVFPTSGSHPMYEPPDDLPAAMQHYLRMWNEPELDRIRGHLDRAVTEDCLWVDPLNNHVGRDALEANVREFRTTYPTAELGLGSNVDSHNGRSRYEWVIVVDGELLLRGFDVMTMAESGLIERVDGFFGTLERVGPE